MAVSFTALAAPAAAAAGCTSAAAATYRHSFDGAHGTVAITATQPLCSGQAQTFSLGSYTVSNSGSFLYDRASGTITRGHGSLSLGVAVPPCATQVTAVLGTGLPVETTGGLPDGGFRLGAAGSRSTGPPAWYSSGGAACSPAARVAFRNACDGTLTAVLADDGAALTAVFVVGGRLIRVASGRTATVTAAPGQTLTIRASTFTTYVGTWRPPATGCTSASLAIPATSAAASPPAVPGAAVTSFPTPGFSATFTAEEQVPDFPPDSAAATGAVAAQPSHSGLSAGSIVATAIGVLMIVGGGVVLTRLIREMRRSS